ncbi:MAG: ATP-binding protein [Bryobacteraceae bacterium]|jgi:signal transduction histidine kinase/ActR/RegA family two-component response regulator
MNAYVLQPKASLTREQLARRIMSKPVRRLYAGLAAVAMLATGSCIGHHTAAPLERIEQVAALPFQVADHRIPVHLKGWITLSDPTTNLVFLEDGTGAARVNLPFLNIDLRTGNLVEVIGEVNEGGSAPTIVASEARLLPGAHEPRALPVQVADLTAGRTGFRYIAVEGVLRSRHQDRAGNAIIRIGSGATVFEANISAIDLPNLTGKIGAFIRIRAVANLSRDVYGHTARVQAWIPRSADVEILALAPPSMPVETVREVEALPRDSLAERMLHLHGSVRSEGVREELRFEDGSGSIRIREAPTVALLIGKAIDVVGFAELDGGELKITDARLLPAQPNSYPAVKNRIIASVAEVHALSPEDAAGAIPVHVRATVTYINPTSNTFFVQDRTGPTYVVAPRIRRLKVEVGDLVDLTGVTAPGQFAPIISAAWAERISSSSMPPPAPVAFDDLFSGKMDSAWIQTEGIVQSVETRRPTLEDAVWVQWGDHRYQLLVHNPNARPLPPPDSRVRVQGVCGSLFNARRQIFGVQVYVPSPEFVHLLEPGPDPATLRPLPIDELLRFSFVDAPGHRTRIRGVVTLASPAGPSYVEDSGAGVKIVNHAHIDLRPGDVVDVLGFSHSGSFSPEMRDAQVSLVERGPTPSPPSITVDEALEGNYDSKLVSIDAAVVDQLRGSNQNATVLQAGGKLFNATLDRVRIPPLDRGSIVRVTGVCSVAAEGNLAYRIPKSFSLVLRSAGDIRVVRPAPWWTPGRLLGVLSSMAALLLVVLSWVAVLRRRVGLQTAVIRKKLQQEEQLKRAAEEASRAKSEFLANMSHEIRTPLNGILGFAGLMAESELTGLQREHNEAVRASAENLLVVINDILDFSRVEAGRIELEAVDFSIRQCVEDALLSVQSLAAEKHIATSVQIAGGVPDWVRGDPHRLRQILLNLLGNAVKFTAAGAVTVRLCLKPEQAAAAAGSNGTPAPRQIQFAVSDTGVGIPAPQRELIFQPFRQADGSITRRFGGTGLGLAISRKLVAMMGGRLWLESTEGQGSTFFFTVPLPAGKAPAKAEEPGGVATGISPAEQPPRQPLSILVADDNMVNQLLVRTLLEKRGHRVTIVGTGAAALAAWLQDRFDCILMDIQMPEMDGYEATRRIRAQESINGAHIPIIALTAHAMKGDREKCLQAGLDSYISKPIETAALDAALASLPARI